MWFDDWLCDVPWSCLSPLPDRLAVKLEVLEAASKEVLLRKEELVVQVNVSNEQFQATVAKLIAKIHEHAASSTAGLRVLCHDRVKLLDAQADVLTVSAGQLTACVAVGKTALAQGNHVFEMHAFDAATRTRELCEVELEPRVPKQIDLAADVHETLVSLEDMAVMRLYDVDGRHSVVSGAGLVSCISGQGAVNEVKVACVNSAGKPTDWVVVDDVVVIARSVDGEVVGRGVGGQVIGKGEILIKYEVDDVDVDEIDLSVIAGGVVMCSGPQRVTVCGAIKTDAVHVTTIPINGTGSYGVAVTLDGLHLVVSNVDSNILSVYSTDTGACITTFGCRGVEAGQFDRPARICATPKGTILVCEYGNKRLQEIAINGEHVCFIGKGHFDDERMYGMCMQGDVVAVGKHGGDTDGRIVLFSYSTGALIRKFGSFGYGEGQVKNNISLSFTPDGRHILVADQGSRLSLFTVDGTFVKTLGTDVISKGCKDVLCSGSNIFVADSSNHRICMFSAETGALTRTWGTEGQADGQFHYPTALTTFRGKLFVVDLRRRSSRVQVQKLNMSKMRHARVRFDNWLHDAPLCRLAVKLDAMEAASKEVLLRKEELVVRVNFTSHNHFLLRYKN